MFKFIVNVRIVCGAKSMKRHGARPSVCLSNSPTAAACGGFAAVGPANRRHRSVAARPASQQHGAAARRAAANAGSATLSVYVRRVAEHRLAIAVSVYAGRTTIHMDVPLCP